MRITRRDCPSCGSARLATSERQTFTEELIFLAGGSVQRCRVCLRRFAFFEGSVVPLEKRRSIQLAGFATATSGALAGLALFWAALAPLR